MHPNDGRVVSNFIMQALQNQDITIYGDGSHTRAFCYVDDMIAGLIALMESGPEMTGPINLGNPRELTIRELADTVVDLSGSSSRIVFRPLPNDDPRQRKPNIDKARELLGWEPKTDLADGLKATILYFEDHLRQKKMKDR
jgi:UDP-glucuronate decarboxylase